MTERLTDNEIALLASASMLDDSLLRRAASQLHALRARVATLEAERDEARREVEHWKLAFDEQLRIAGERTGMVDAEQARADRLEAILTDVLDLVGPARVGLTHEQRKVAAALGDRIRAALCSTD